MITFFILILLHTVSKIGINGFLTLRRSTDRNFRGNLLENHYRHLKLHSNPPNWLARSRCHMGTFRQKVEVQIFDRTYSPCDNVTPPISRILISRHLIFCWLTSPSCSRFAAWDCIEKEELNPQTQTFLLNLSLWPP